ncbi:MAG: AMIN domain-containing protein, partial [Candidatus Hydrogenedentes bacterium]|nr:AMIN domain-containing protein [Candidatus Hydrogenedentota bacterium]
MSKRRCFILATVVLLAGTFSAGVAFAATSAEQIELRKKEVIRESLQKLGQPTENLALLEAASRAEALLEVKIERGVRETRVSILTTDEPAYESFPMQERQRIVIDVYNTINFHSGDTYETTAPSVLKSVRTSLFQLEPQFTSRIVLDLERMVEVSVTQQGQKIEVLIPEDVEVPVAEPAAPEVPVAVAQAVAEPEPQEAELAEEAEQLEEQEVEVVAQLA